MLMTPYEVEEWFHKRVESGRLSIDESSLQNLLVRISYVILEKENSSIKEGNERYALSRALIFIECLFYAINPSRGCEIWNHLSDDYIECRVEKTPFCILEPKLNEAVSMYFSLPWLRCDYLDWLFVDIFCFLELSRMYENMRQTRERGSVLFAFLRVALASPPKALKHPLIPTFNKMRIAYWDMDSRLISVSRVRHSLTVSVDAGAIWPSPIWPILERCQTLGIEAWALTDRL